MRTLFELLARFAAPVVLLAAAFAAVYFGDVLPPSLAGPKAYGPYIVLAAGAALAIAFGRGRALFALITLVIACGAQQHWLQGGLAAPGARAVYAALAVFVPSNLALFAALPERGVFTRHGALRLALIAVEAALAAWVVLAGLAQVVDWAWRRFLPFPFGIGALPQAGAVTTLLAVIVALGAAFASRSATAASCAGAIVAFAVAVHVPTASYTFSIFTAAAALMLTVGLLHDTFRVVRRN
jgi:hypothetical protein